MITTVEFDTPFIPDDIYTRANAGEVFPYLLQPLMWTLVGPALERGFMRCMAEDFGAVTPLPGGYRACGRMAARLHLNLSVFRTVAARAPGSTPHDLDIQYFGDAVASGLPAHPAGADSFGDKLKVTLSALGTMATFNGRVKREAAAARASVTTAKAVVTSSPTPQALLAAIDTALDLYSDTFGSHVTARALTSSAVTVATNALRAKGIDENNAIVLISTLPDLESVKPSRHLDEIADSIRNQTSLSGAVSSGLTWKELVESAEPSYLALRSRLDAFIAEFGHRGVNEFDPTYPVWGTNPDGVLALLRRVLSSTSATTTHSYEAAAVPAGRATSLVKSARAAITRAEITKDSVVRSAHAVRLLVDELISRVNATREDVLAMSIDELRAVLNGGPIPVETISRRRAELEWAEGIEVAEWSIGTLGTVDHGVETVTKLEGIAGARGLARGFVRVMKSVEGEFEDGEVLVADVTDTAWTPLFLAASAVVTNRGGALSHATIVARELGIPAVINTKGATHHLHDGDLVEVDGTAGIVRILERKK